MSSNNVRMRIPVGEKEECIVMGSYLNIGYKGWNEVLKDVKDKIQNSSMNTRLVEYYIDGEDSVSTRRIKRIVRERQKKEAELYHAHGKTSEKNKATTKPKNETKKSSSDKAKQKFSFFMDSESNSSSGASDTEEINETQAIVKKGIDKMMHFSRKRAPEERKKEKKSIVPYEVTSDTDDEKPAKKKQSLREANLEAQKAHTKMCEQANAAMALMSNVLTKLDKKIDDL
ncbi:uncharacterized protein LOC110248002 [Exaiptasia diaphana]|uniref:Uncharacterized protein n=1 Tax=Exaiptasia diaphana TaxID=2652724 RepID=A0A913XW64_EXADI|nr:uncharacterized protein LOC110248002 [Exaiptasia diaphana]